jgi:hypothetical protein
MPLIFFINNPELTILGYFFMKSLVAKGASDLAPFAAATAVAFISAIIGFGFYHGEFHMNSNSTHCHSEGICHNH